MSPEAPLPADRVLDEGVAWLVDRVAGPPLPVSRVTANGFTVDVVHGHPAIHDQLVERLTPFYTVRALGRRDPAEVVAAQAAGDRMPTDRVTLLVLEADATAPSRPSSPYRVRHSEEAVSYRRPGAWWAGGGGWAALDERSGTISAGAWHAGLAVLLGRRRRGLAKDCRRAVQDIVRLGMIERGGVYLEAAGVAAGDAVVLAAGSGGAGKTTWLASMLTRGRGAFVANDEVLLIPGPVTRVLGAPVHVMVRRDLATRYPQLASVVAGLAPHEPKRSMHWRDFAAALGATVRAGGRLAGLLVLEPGRRVSLAEPDEVPALLEPSRLWGPDWTTPWVGVGPPSWTEREAPSLAAVTGAGPVVRFGRSGDATRALALLPVDQAAWSSS